MSAMNYKLIGVLLAGISLIVMPIFTLFTIVPYFLEIYGFPPLIPSILEDVDWHLFIIIGGAIPIYSLLLVEVYIGFKKFKNPNMNTIQEFEKIIKRIPRFIRKIVKNL